MDALWTIIAEAAISGSVIAAVVTGFFKLLTDSIANHRAQVNSIWTSINKHIATSYWPLAMAAWGISSNAKAWVDTQPRASGHVLSCFHWYAQYQAIGARMSRSKVWILLTHTDSEQYAQDLGIQMLSRPGFSALELSTIAHLVRLDASLADTSEQVSSHPKLRAFYAQFEKWMIDPKSAAAVDGMAQDGELLAQLFASEYNRMYRSWYGRDILFQSWRLRRKIRRHLYAENPTGNN